MMYMAIGKLDKMLINLKKQAQIEIKAQVEALIFNEVFTIIPAKYFNYSNILFIEYATEFPKHIKRNNYVIERKKRKQPSFGLIYSLALIKKQKL